MAWRRHHLKIIGDMTKISSENNGKHQRSQQRNGEKAVAA